MSSWNSDDCDVGIKVSISVASHSLHRTQCILFPSYTRISPFFTLIELDWSCPDQERSRRGHWYSQEEIRIYYRRNVRFDLPFLIFHIACNCNLFTVESALPYLIWLTSFLVFSYLFQGTKPKHPSPKSKSNPKNWRWKSKKCRAQCKRLPSRPPRLWLRGRVRIDAINDKSVEWMNSGWSSLVFLDL